MGFRLALQPFWVRALRSGALFALLFGLQISFERPFHAVSVIAVALAAGAAFGVFMAYQGQSAHIAMSEAVAGLDDSRRSEAIGAATDGHVPDDPAVRDAGLRLGIAYLRGKTDAQLKRSERQTWLVLALLAAGIICLAITGTRIYEVAFAIVMLLLCLVVLPLGMLRTRRTQRNVLRLSADTAAR